MQVLRIWDALVISRFKLVDFMCVAMLGHARERVLLSDSTETLKYDYKHDPLLY